MRETEFEQRDEIGPYHIVRSLGQGGMGTVYEVEHAEQGGHYALKMFTLDHGNVDFLRKRFLAEVKVLERLAHPRLVHVHGLGVDAATERPYFVMDLVLDERGDPTTLEDVRRAGKVSEALAERWYADLCAALDYCHAQGVIHRDIKLNNVLLDATGHAVLSDFGVSRIFDQEVRNELQMTTTFVEGETTGTRPVMGTYWYLAPEIRKGGEATPASDWYALGVLFFRLLTGMWYESGTNAFELLAPFDRRWRIRLERLLAEDPDLRCLIGTGPQGGCGERGSCAWRRLTIAAVAVIAVAVICGAGFLWRVSRKPATSLSLPVDATNRLDFCLCPAGTNSCRKVAVTVADCFWLGRTPVTRRQWFAVRGEPVTSWPGGEDAPMTYVSREDVTNFCARLNALWGGKLPNGYEVRLPTLAEWSLALTAGRTVPEELFGKKGEREAFVERGWFGQGVDGEAKFSNMRAYYEGLNGPIPLVTNIWRSFPPKVINPDADEWERYSSQIPPVPVGLKPPNGLGLRDMVGNCFERVEDTCSAGLHHWGKTEWGVTVLGLYGGQGQSVTNPVERTGTCPLMIGGYLTPDETAVRPWSALFERMPHLGFRLCIGPRLND